MEGSEPIKVAGIEVPAEERTPLVDRWLRVIEEQRAEIRALRGEHIVIDDHITVTVLKVQGHQIRLGIEAPNEIPIKRKAGKTGT